MIIEDLIVYLKFAITKTAEDLSCCTEDKKRNFLLNKLRRLGFSLESASDLKEEFGKLLPK